MIRIEDMTVVDDQWYDIGIEILPCKAHWNRGHRWYGEVLARTSNWPRDDERGIWNHYYFLDFGTWTLRGAWFRGWKAIDQAADYIRDHPDDRPDRD